MAAQMIMSAVSTSSYPWRLNTGKLPRSKAVVSHRIWGIQPACLLARRYDALTVTATSNEGDETKDPAGSSTSTSKSENSESSAAETSISKKRAKAEAEVRKGQRTAIVTGAVSVLLGVAYLVLIQILDTRGVILVPPPPEAFDP